MGPVDWDDKHAAEPGRNPNRVDKKRKIVRKRTDNPRGVSLGGRDIEFPLNPLHVRKEK